MAKKSVTIKLEPTGDTSFGRESYYVKDFGPFKANLNDDSTLTVACLGDQPQICPKKTNDKGDYWMFDILGGKAFASIVDHEKYGRYLRVRLGDNVKLPSEVAEKVSGGGRKSYSNNNYTKKSNSQLWS